MASKNIYVRFLSWLINFYPDHIYLSDTFKDLGPGDEGKMSMIALSCLSTKVPDVGNQYICEVKSLRSSKKYLGHFKITVERLPDE